MIHHATSLSLFRSVFCLLWLPAGWQGQWAEVNRVASLTWGEPASPIPSPAIAAQVTVPILGERQWATAAAPFLSETGPAEEGGIRVKPPAHSPNQAILSLWKRQGATVAALLPSWSGEETSRAKQQKAGSSQFGREAGSFASLPPSPPGPDKEAKEYSFLQESFSWKADKCKIFILEGACFLWENEHLYTCKFYWEYGSSPSGNIMPLHGLYEHLINQSKDRQISHLWCLWLDRMLSPWSLYQFNDADFMLNEKLYSLEKRLAVALITLIVLVKICWNQCIYKITEFRSLCLSAGSKALSQLSLLKKKKKFSWSHRERKHLPLIS